MRPLLIHQIQVCRGVKVCAHFYTRHIVNLAKFGYDRVWKIPKILEVRPWPLGKLRASQRLELARFKCSQKIQNTANAAKSSKRSNVAKKYVEPVDLAGRKPNDVKHFKLLFLFHLKTSGPEKAGSILTQHAGEVGSFLTRAGLSI